MITKTSAVHTEIHHHTRVIEFEGAEPILLERRYSHGGKQFLPTKAWAKWKHGEPIKEIEVEGSVLKKDGTPGGNTAGLRYLTPAHYSHGKGWELDAPDWVLALFSDAPYTKPEADSE